MLRQLPTSMAFLTKLESLDLGSNEIDELVSGAFAIFFLFLVTEIGFSSILYKVDVTISGISRSKTHFKTLPNPENLLMTV